VAIEALGDQELLTFPEGRDERSAVGVVGRLDLTGCYVRARELVKDEIGRGLVLAVADSVEISER
jgi:hypothetical protein